MVTGQLVADVLNSQHAGEGAIWRINTKILLTCRRRHIVSPCRSLCVKLSEFNLFDYFTFFNNSSYNFMDVMHDVWSEETLKNRHCVFCYTALLYTVQSSRKCSGVVCDVNDQYAVGLYLLICTFI